MCHRQDSQVHHQLVRREQGGIFLYQTPLTALLYNEQLSVHPQWR